MPKQSLIAGKNTHKRYKDTTLESIVGKTVEALSWSTWEGAYGIEPCLVIMFSDGTKHWIVVPGNEE